MLAEHNHPKATPMDPLPEPQNVLCPQCGNNHFETLDDRRLVIKCSNTDCSETYRQIAMMLVTPELVANMTHGIFRVVHDAVEDAQVISSCYDFQRQCFAMLIWSASFDLVPEFNAVPMMPAPQISRLEIIPTVEPGVVFGVISDPEHDDPGEQMVQMKIGIKADVFEHAVACEARERAEAMIRVEIRSLVNDLAPQVLDAYIDSTQCQVGWKS